MRRQHLSPWSSIRAVDFVRESLKGERLRENSCNSSFKLLLHWTGN